MLQTDTKLTDLQKELEAQQRENRLTLTGCGTVEIPGVFPDDDDDDWDDEDDDWDDDDDDDDWDDDPGGEEVQGKQKSA